MNEGTTVLRNTQSSRHRHRLCHRRRYYKFEPRGQDEIWTNVAPLLLSTPDPRIPKLNMSLSRIPFVSLLNALSSSLIRTEYLLLVQEQRDRDRLFRRSPPPPPSSCSRWYSSYPSFHHHSIFHCPSHYSTTIRAERVLLICCIHRYTLHDSQRGTERIVLLSFR